MTNPVTFPDWHETKIRIARDKQPSLMNWSTPETKWLVFPPQPFDPPTSHNTWEEAKAKAHELITELADKPTRVSVTIPSWNDSAYFKKYSLLIEYDTQSIDQLKRVEVETAFGTTTAPNLHYLEAHAIQLLAFIAHMIDRTGDNYRVIYRSKK